MLPAFAAPIAPSRRAALATLVAGLATCFAAVAAGPAAASHHITEISEVMTSYGGDSTVQFLEMRMEYDNNYFVAGSKLSTFAADGTFQGVLYTVPANVGGGAGRAWLMATSSFQTLAALAPDFIIPAGLPVDSGMICWGSPSVETDPDTYVDCVAYGNYTGPVPQLVGDPTPLDPVGHSLLRTGTVFEHNNAADYTCGNPASPENNAGRITHLSQTSPCPVCGNLSLEPGEQCESNDDALCPGLCTGECMCGNVCGNDFREPIEECDGPDAAACSVSCQLNCTCGPTAPLSRDERKCAQSLLRFSSKTLSSYGKAAAFCIRDFGRERTVDDPYTCVTADPRGKLAKAAAKVDALLAGGCGLGYAVDCPEPCAATDDGGLSAAVDDATELADCLRCLNAETSISDDPAPLAKGVHGRVLDGATLDIWSIDPSAAKCQARVSQNYEKLFSIKIRELGRCAGPLLVDQTPPVGAACIGSDPRGVIAKARAKLLAAVGRCTPPAAFDGGACADLSGAALEQCLDSLSECEACTWANALLGTSVDCDQLDNGAADASCN